MNDFGRNVSNKSWVGKTVIMSEMPYDIILGIDAMKGKAILMKLHQLFILMIYKVLTFRKKKLELNG